jgi:DNA-binding phage protein
MSSATSVKSQLAEALRKKMIAENLTISALAKKTKTGRNAIKRVLDKRNTAITLKTIAKTTDALGLQISLSVRPASADELNSIANQMVNAPTATEAEKLKQRYLAGFYGLPSHAENPAG